MPTSAPTEAAIPADRRQAWIAEAAYYLAERRGFRGGCPVEDWLWAERVYGRHEARSLPPPRIALVFLDRSLSGEA